MHLFRCLTLAIVSSTAVSAQEWTRFRGPGGSGVNERAKTLPAEFTPEQYRWKIALPGAGTSSPVLWGTKLFITSESGGAGERSVLCLDSLTGKQLWAHQATFKPYEHHKFNNFASATPTVDENHVYISWTSGEEMHVLALSHAGQKVWEANLGFFSEEHGSGASPIVVGKTLIISKDHHKEDAFLAGLNTADGQIIWKLPRTTTRSSFSTPIVVEEIAGRPIVIFSSNPQALTALDPATGKELWHQDYPDKTGFRSVGSPAYTKGIYFCTVGQGMGGREGVALRIKDGKPVTAWELPKALPYVPTPLGLGEYFYMLNDGGILSCLEAATGKVVYNERVAENAYSSPVCAGDKIYCISRKGEVTTVKAGPKFEVLGKCKLGEDCESTPAIANDMLFIRTAGHLIAIGGPKPQARKDAFDGKGVDIEMVSEVTHIQPGKAFRVGFFLRHEQAYHTYWKNPGLAGVKFSADWKLPDGWSVSEMTYAVPDKVYMAEILTHGYERDVLHWVSITPPAELKEFVTLSVKTSWMACAVTCNPGFCDLELTLPVKPEPANLNATWSPKFAASVAEMPITDPSWKFTAIREGDKIRLTGTSAKAGQILDAQKSEPIFFNDHHFICSHLPQKWTISDSQITAVLPIAEFASKGVTHLTGLLFSKTGWSSQTASRYLEVNIPITEAVGKQ
jgi:outer membrane protein assembly factor BamB